MIHRHSVKLMVLITAFSNYGLKTTVHLRRDRDELRSLFQEELDDLGLVGLGCQVDGLLAKVVSRVEACAQLQQQRADGLLARRGR